MIVTIFRMILFAVCLLAPGVAVLAQADEPVDDQAVPANLTTVSATLRDIVGESLEMRGMRPDVAVWVQLPRNWVIDQPITLDLAYTGSPALSEELSSVTLYTDGVELTSFIPVLNGQPQRYTVEIPPDRLFGTGFELGMRAYLRQSPRSCEDGNLPSQWLTFLPETRLTVAADTDPASPQLEDVSASLYSDSAFTRRIPLAFIVPSLEDSAALSVAAQIAYRLGSESGGALPTLIIRTPDTITEDELARHHLAIIGLPTANPYIEQAAAAVAYPALKEGLFYTLDDEVILNGDGVLHLVSSPWNPTRNALIVSGNDAAGLLRAGQAFVDSALYTRLTGSSSFISSLWVPAAPTILPAWTGESTSLSQLGLRTETIYGYGMQERSYGLPRPVGRLLQEGSTVTLNLAHSPLREGSHVAVYLGSTFIGTVNTDDGSTASQTFTLPVDALNQAYLEAPDTRLRMRLEVVNLFAYDDCQLISQRTNWTRLEDTTSFTLSHTPIAQPNVRAFPYPFVDVEMPAPVTLVAPTAPTADDLQWALLLATQLGRLSLQDIELRLTTTDQLTTLQRADGHLIVLGESERQPLAAEIESLTLQAAAEGSPVYQWLDTENVGVVRQVISPYEGTFSALLVYGSTVENYRAAAATLLYSRTDPELASVRIISEDEQARLVRWLPPTS